MTQVKPVYIVEFHADQVAELYEAVQESLDETAPWLSDLHADITPEDVEEYVRSQPQLRADRQGYNFAIVDHDGAILGGCGLTQINWKHRFANLFYWTRKSAVGHGVAPAAVRLLAAFAFNTLELYRVEIVVDIENARSIRVAEKVGAIREGVARNRLNTHDTPRDAYMYSLTPDAMI